MGWEASLLPLLPVECVTLVAMATPMLTVGTELITDIGGSTRYIMLIMVTTDIMDIMGTMDIMVITAITVTTVIMVITAIMDSQLSRFTSGEVMDSIMNHEEIIIMAVITFHITIAAIITIPTIPITMATIMEPITMVTTMETITMATTIITMVIMVLITAIMELIMVIMELITQLIIILTAITQPIMEINIIRPIKKKTKQRKWKKQLPRILEKRNPAIKISHQPRTSGK
jgi:hypothetical protein